MRKITTILLLVIMSTGQSQDCFYNSTPAKIGFIQCNRQAEDVKGIFISDNDVPYINKETFAGFAQLANLDISRTPIKTIQPGSFDHLKLHIVKLNDNKINSIENGTFNALDETTMLELAGNELTFLGAEVFLGMKSLVWISLSANKIKIVHKDAFRGLADLEYIHMIYNDIESFELGTFEDLLSLEFLDLAANSLKNIQFGLFSNQRNLKNLNLNGNQLEYLPDFLFANATALKELDLSENKFSNVQKNLFYGIENLEKLIVSSNKIRQIDAQGIFVQLPKLQEVILYSNPWKCEKLKSVKQYFDYNNIYIPIPIPFRNAPNVDGILCQDE